MTAAWPFDDPPNTASLTSADILDRHLPILWVSRDEDDWGFQFHSANGAPDDLAEGRVVGLGTMLRLDPSLAAVADLPPGWRAHRVAPDAPWQRAGPDKRPPVVAP